MACAGLRILAALVTIGVWVAGCGEPSEPTGGAGGTGGDSGQGGGAGSASSAGAALLDVLDVRIGYFSDVSIPLEPVAPGQVFLLKGAIQGGYVQYVAPQVRGLTTLNVETRARVRDPETRYLLLDEGRTPVMKPVPTEPSWFEPDLAEFRDVNHLVMCPHNTNDVVLDRDLQLELRVTELEGDQPKTGTATLVVRFACDDNDALPEPLRCSCQCAPESQQASCYDESP